MSDVQRFTHESLTTAIEKARTALGHQTVTRTDSGFPHPPQVANFGVAAAVDALLDALADILIIAADIRCPECLDYDADCYVYEQADALRATVTTALRKMGALDE